MGLRNGDRIDPLFRFPPAGTDTIDLQNQLIEPYPIPSVRPKPFLFRTDKNWDDGFIGSCRLVDLLSFFPK